MMTIPGIYYRAAAFLAFDGNHCATGSAYLSRAVASDLKSTATAAIHSMRDGTPMPEARSFKLSAFGHWTGDYEKSAETTQKFLAAFQPLVDTCKSHSVNLCLHIEDAKSEIFGKVYDHALAPPPSRLIAQFMPIPGNNLHNR